MKTFGDADAAIVLALFSAVAMHALIIAAEGLVPMEDLVAASVDAGKKLIEAVQAEVEQASLKSEIRK